jgi:fucose permease
LKIQALALLLGTPFIFLVGRFQDLHMVYLMLGIFGFFRGVYDSNIYAALYEVMPAELRAASSSVMIAVAFSAGAIAPAVLGMIGETAGLGVGISSLSIAYLCGAMFIFSALRFFAVDRAKVVQHAGA